MGGVYKTTIQMMLLLGTQLAIISPQVVFRDNPFARTSFRDTPESRLLFPDEVDQSYCENTCARLSQNQPDVKCRCDRQCSTMKDCCVDSQYRGRSMSSVKMECLPPHDDFAVYTITKCKKRWRGPSGIALNCTRAVDFSSDPVGQLPVTNTVTGATYKNKYCALCNDDTSTTYWQIAFNCLFNKQRTTVEYAMENIAYNEEKGQWGLWLDQPQGDPVFHSCRVYSLVPTALENTVRRCYGVEVSTCPANWENPVVRRKCAEYLDPVKANGLKYRNLNCAICNGINETNAFCMSIHNRTVARPNAALPNFSMLMDVNANNCEQGGGKCPCGETWDNFFKKCRRIVALPFR